MILIENQIFFLFVFLFVCFLFFYCFVLLFLYSFLFLFFVFLLFFYHGDNDPNLANVISDCMMICIIDNKRTMIIWILFFVDIDKNKTIRSMFTKCVLQNLNTIKVISIIIKSFNIQVFNQS